MCTEWDQNFERLTPGSHLWTNSSNYLENLQKLVKIDFSFWLQSHCATLKRIEIDIYVYGMRPKFWKIDHGKPFVDKLVKLSRKLTERSENWLQFLIALTLCYIKKNRNWYLCVRNETKIFKVWRREAIYGQTRQIISKTYREEWKLTSVFGSSHIVLHSKK